MGDGGDSVQNLSGGDGLQVPATIGSAGRQKEKEQIIKKLEHSKYPEESKAYRDTLRNYDLTPKEAKKVEGILKKQSER